MKAIDRLTTQDLLEEHSLMMGVEDDEADLQFFMLNEIEADDALLKDENEQRYRLEREETREERQAYAQRQPQRWKDKRHPADARTRVQRKTSKNS